MAIKPKEEDLKLSDATPNQDHSIALPSLGPIVKVEEKDPNLKVLLPRHGDKKG